MFGATNIKKREAACAERVMQTAFGSHESSVPRGLSLSLATVAHRSYFRRTSLIQ
jgi:hypothetical protein